VRSHRSPCAIAGFYPHPNPLPAREREEREPHPNPLLARERERSFHRNSCGYALVTSELTWLEILTKPFRDNTRLEALFRAFLTAEEMTLVTATLPIWEQAARLRGLGLKTPDALHAATGLAVGCSLFVTNDLMFQRVASLPAVILNTLN